MLTDLLRPRALLSHALVLFVAATCVVLGQWQFDRLAQVRENNALLEQRLQNDPVALGELVGAPTVDEAELEYRPVTARGTFRPAQELLQRGAQHQNQQGFSILTPFDLTDGGVVLVRRGFVPAALDTPPVAEAAPPTGEVELHGILERPVPNPPRGPQDPAEGHMERVFHADTARLDQQVDGTLYPMVLRLQTDEPVAYDAMPVPPAPPVLDEANHFSYAMQWHSFAVLAVVTYVAWLVTQRRQRQGGRPDAEAPTSPGTTTTAGHRG
ncbi:SURF1 family protein [Egicoccus halophilus]|uniref:SURF1-like protein n=1 Tax=Egicoccus halophilus TaxID=1670830 RepID=A0A8J3EVH2_9ACTN|nr:SURF1 family protein [Egicoccus halophilus]GGI09711.1 SURF1-like protein [Egicoccus halophilus]